jgi:hypothetical protein
MLVQSANCAVLLSGAIFLNLRLTLRWVNRDLTSNITLGQVIPHLVSLFQSIDEVVNENDHQHALETNDNIDLSGYSLEYKFYVIA